MHKKSLLETNPYLRDPDESKHLIFTSVSTSSAIESVHIKTAMPTVMEEEEKKSSALRSVSKSSAIR